MIMISLQQTYAALVEVVHRQKMVMITMMVMRMKTATKKILALILIMVRPIRMVILVIGISIIHHTVVLSMTVISWHLIYAVPVVVGMVVEMEMVTKMKLALI